MKINEVCGSEYAMEASYTTSISDDFDVYFKRAAQLQLQPQLDHLNTPVHHHHDDDQQQQQAGLRRDSAPPDRRSSSTERRRVGASGSVRHKRTASCRYPQRRPAVTVTQDVNVTADQLLSPGEHTPLTAGCHRARLNDHVQLGESSLSTVSNWYAMYVL